MFYAPYVKISVMLDVVELKVELELMDDLIIGCIL